MALGRVVARCFDAGVCLGRIEACREHRELAEHGGRVVAYLRADRDLRPQRRLPGLSRLDVLEEHRDLPAQADGVLEAARDLIAGVRPGRCVDQGLQPLHLQQELRLAVHVLAPDVLEPGTQALHLLAEQGHARVLRHLAAPLARGHDKVLLQLLRALQRHGDHVLHVGCCSLRCLKAGDAALGLQLLQAACSLAAQGGASGELVAQLALTGLGSFSLPHYGCHLAAKPHAVHDGCGPRCCVDGQR
mmetsp:Transcript_92276/g.287199  ORF Transcript_92276/g.287199 Transcript_92276/m.287199 type:complete len:246 (+) Transcript_92276:354-1091(+)